jgi:hypothetical protein
LEISIEISLGITEVELFKVIIYPNISAPLTSLTIDLVDLKPRTTHLPIIWGIDMTNPTLFNYAGSGTDACLTSIMTWDHKNLEYKFTPAATTPLGTWTVVVEAKPPGLGTLSWWNFTVTIIDS